jgi:hypothetical protein
MLPAPLAGRGTQRLLWPAAASLVVAALALVLGSDARGQGGVGPGGTANPCLGPSRANFLCPDLLMGPPSDLYVDPFEHPGRVLLRSTNDIRSRGRGPFEVRMRRYRPRWARGVQTIYKVGGGFGNFPTRMQAHFFDVGDEYGGSYWKARDPVRFELWTLAAQRGLGRRVRVGPKQFYCFRDLEHTRPGMRRSPNHRVYPGCSQDPDDRFFRLGTSVGWSDVYPSTYDLQWIDVTGLRGCFVYMLIADPLDLLYEENESNNRSRRIVRLPYHDGPQNC